MSTNWKGLTIAHRIRIAAQIRQYTMADVAMRAKIPRSTMYNVVSDANVPLLDTVMAIADALDCRLGFLLEGEEPIFRQAETQKTGEAVVASPQVPRSPVSDAAIADGVAALQRTAPAPKKKRKA